MNRKTIVISAVNLVEAGTLAILKDCLQYLSNLAQKGDYRVIAIVFDKKLANFPNIEYIETQWPKKRWINRLWYEYVSLKSISKKLAPVDLWFSLHDTTPTVLAKNRAVYCHNSYSFYKWKMHDLLFAPKIALFAIFTKYIYKTNIHKNNFLVVQQDWFREAMSKMFNFDKSKIIVAPPTREMTISKCTDAEFELFTFIFAGSANSHKNFEVICKAAEHLEKQGISNFRVCITVNGTENKYAKWLKSNWGTLDTVEFIGFQTKECLINFYAKSHCLIFPSKVETWGLPISEYAGYNKPMLLADLPYTHETASSAKYVAYFDPNNELELAAKMELLLKGETSFLKEQQTKLYAEPFAENWEKLFQILLKNHY